MQSRNVITRPNRAPTLCVLLNITSVITTDPNIANSCTIAEIILITLANFLCFLASFRRSIAHRIAPAIRIIPSSAAKVDTVTNGVEEVIECIIIR
ncbi:MAG: hypothetical protein WCG98_07835 [bacterium]